jgi:SNF2 family DNA or RNA helicase
MTLSKLILFQIVMGRIPLFKGNNLLKDYQEQGFRWLVHSYYQKRNTMLADEMGLGKTIQAVYFCIEKNLLF